MPGTLQPLDPQFAIADLQGRPTLYFIKWAQQKQIDIGGSAQLDGGNDFIGDQNIDGNLTVTDGGVTLKADPTSLGFTIADRAVVPGHQINFISNAPITGGGAVLNIFAAKSSAAAKNISQIALWTVPPTDPSIVQGAIRAATGASGEELILLTQQFGAAGLIAGDIVFEPNATEKLRILSAAGDPAVKVTGQLSVTDDPYSASWDGSTDVPTKNAVYDKIQTMGGGGGYGYEGFGNLLSIAALTKLAGASANITLANGVKAHRYSWTASGANTLQLATFAAPATPWNVYLRFIPDIAYPANVQFGLVLRNSVSGKVTTLTWNSDVNFSAQEWTNPTTFSVNLVNVASPRMPCNWIRINNDGTTLSFYRSVNGVDWVLLTTRTLAAFMGSVDQIGLGGVPQSAGSAFVSDFGLVVPA